MLKIKMLRINKYNLYFMIALLPVIWPAGVTKAYFPNFGDFITSIGLLLSIMLTMLVSGFSTKLLFNKLNIILITLFCVFLFSTFFNELHYYIDYIKVFCCIYSLVCCYLFACNSNMIDEFVNTYIFLMTILLIWGLTTQIMHPEGIAYSYYTNIIGDYKSKTPVYFWGNKNYFGYYLVPYVFFILLRQDLGINKSNRAVDSALIVIAFTLIILTGSATSLLSLSLLVGMKVFFSIRCKQNLSRFMKPQLIIYIYLLLFVFIVMFRFQNGIVSWISDLFNKSTILTGRDIIWENAIEKISQSPIWGYGYDNIIPHTGYNWYAHNLILDLMIQGGILALIIFSVFVYISVKRLDDATIAPQIKYDIIAFIAALSLSQLVESCVKSNPFLYLAFYIAFSSQYLGETEEVFRSGRRN